MSKKIISLCLAAMLSVSMVGVASVSVSADIDENGRYVPSAGTETYRYYFYMPDNWYNEFTDTTGAYWWEGTDACPSWQEMYKAQVSEVENIYYIDCPADVVKVIFNNFVDGGEDASAPIYTKAAQTVDITAGPQEDEELGTWAYFPEYDGIPGDSDLYPEGIKDFNNMIYVVDENKIDINPLNQKQTCRGEWYYYYGNGEYGYAPTKGEGAVYTGCYQTIEDAIADKQNGVTGGDTTEPTTEATTATEAPTEAPTAAPEVAPLTVNATSNFFPEAKAEYNEETKEVTVTYTLGLAKKMVNTEWYLTYDPAVLSFAREKNSTDSGWTMMPQVTTGAVYNTTIPGEINCNASSLAMYKVTDEQPFVQVTFDVIGEGETTIDLQVRVLSIGDADPNTFQVDQNSIKYYASQYEVKEVEGVAAPTKKTELTPSTFVPATQPATQATTAPATEATKATDATTATNAPATDATSATGATVNGGSTADTPSNGGSTNNGAVKTGDASLAVVILTLLVASTGVMFVVRKREMF